MLGKTDLQERSFLIVPGGQEEIFQDTRDY